MKRYKRYLVFAYDTYHPSGGWGDFLFSTDTQEEAMSKVEGLWRRYDNVDIVDLEKEEVLLGRS